MEPSLTSKSGEEKTALSSLALFKSSAETEPITRNNIKTTEKIIAYFLLEIISTPSSLPVLKILKNLSNNLIKK